MANDPIMQKMKHVAISKAESSFPEMLAEIANEQLIEQGYDSVPLNVLTAAFEKIIKDVSSADRVLEATLSGYLPDNATVKISFGNKEMKKVSAKTREFTDLISDAMTQTIGQMRKSNVRDLLKRWPEENRRLKNEQHNFAFRLDSRWGRALSLLRLMLHISRELGAMYTDRHSRSRSKKTVHFRQVITPIHVRACQVLDEIICLLENGFPEGALARWRTLHELSIVAQLLEEGPDELSRRYHAHQIIVRKKEIDEAFLRPTRRLTNHQKKFIEDVESKYQASLVEFGRDFRHKHGWASAYLSINSPSFDDIQRKVNDGSVHENYKQACYTVHASAPATFFSLSTPYSDGLVAGASNYGLDVPGIASAFSIVRINAILVGKLSAITDVIIIGSLPDLRGKIAKEFSRVAAEIDFQEFEEVANFAECEQFEQ